RADRELVGTREEGGVQYVVPRDSRTALLVPVARLPRALRPGRVPVVIQILTASRWTDANSSKRSLPRRSFQHLADKCPPASGARRCSISISTFVRSRPLTSRISTELVSR